MEDRHVVGFPRCVDRRRLRPVRAGRVGRQLRRLRQSRLRRRASGRAAVLPHRRCDQREPEARRAGVSSAAAAGARRRLQRIGRSAECRMSADRQHLVHPRRFADSREPGASTRMDRHAHRRAGVPAVRSDAHAFGSVRVLADRAAAIVRAGRHAAASAAAGGRLSARHGRRHAAADHFAGHCRDLHDPRRPHRQRDRAARSERGQRGAPPALVRRRKLRRDECAGHRAGVESAQLGALHRPHSGRSRPSGQPAAGCGARG